jgi:hypothetical protein
MGLIPDRLHQHPLLQVEEKFPSHFCLPRGFHETKHLWFLLRANPRDSHSHIGKKHERHREHSIPAELLFRV